MKKQPADSGHLGYPQIFINCPYDKRFDFIYQYIVLCAVGCGLAPVSARDTYNKPNRLELILELLIKCEYSIHDLTACRGHLNMPFELGAAVMLDKRDSKRIPPTWIVLSSTRQNLKSEISDLNGIDSLRYDPSQPKSLVPLLVAFLRELRGADPHSTPKPINEAYKRYRKILNGYGLIWKGEIPSLEIRKAAFEALGRKVLGNYLRLSELPLKKIRNDGNEGLMPMAKP